MGPHPLPSRPTQPLARVGAPAPSAQAMPSQAGQPGSSSLPPRPGFVAAARGAHSPPPAQAAPPLVPPPPPAPRPPSLTGPSGAPSPAPPHARTPAPAPPQANDSAPPPWPGVRPPLRPQDARTTAQLVELGEGWRVLYRAWKAPALLLDPPAEGAPLALLLDWDPLAPASLAAPGAAQLARSTASAGKDDAAPPPPAKKAKKGARVGTGNAFDELLAEELAGSTPSGGTTLSLATPLASPSLLPPMGAPAPAPQGRIPAALKAAQAAAAAAAAASSPSATSTSALQPDAGPSSAAPSPPDPSPAARLRARLAALHPPSSASSPDPLAAAQASLELHAARAKDEGKDRLALLSWVGSASVRVGARKAEKAEKDKGKGKAKEGAAEMKRERSVEGSEGVEGEGRTLWVFAVVRGGEAEGDVAGLDELAFEGLEPFASGDFTHATLFPALYPSKAGPSNGTYTSPLSLPANAYPSALALSDALLSIPLIAQPPPAQTPLQAAYESFRRAVASLLLDELVARPPPPHTRCVRVGDTAVYLPSPTSASARLAPPPALRLSLAPASLLRSALQLHSSLSAGPLAALPRGGIAAGTPIRLAPLDARATLLRTLRLSPARRAELEAEWAPHVARAADAPPEGEGFVLCALTLDAPAAGGSKDSIEVVWPRALVLLDCARERPVPSAAAVGPALQKDACAGAASSPASSPERGDAVLPPPGARAPRMRTVGDAPLRARLAGQVLRCRASGGRRPRESDGAGAVGAMAGEGVRDPLRRRTGDVWRWMGEEERRREEEKENAARREAEKEKEDDAAAPPSAAAAKEDDKPPAHTAAAAAAPINMRTPMSLGTSSTEAPSPAELFALQPGHAAPPAPPTTAVEQPHDALQGMDIDFGLGMYPSPAEPGASTSIAPAPSSSAAPMSTLDAAFSEFDWGDGTFGTSGMGGGQGGGQGGTGGNGGGGGFDDGIMLGLTDDDFSFFDAPTPAPAGALSNSLALSMPPPLAPTQSEMGVSAMPVVSGMDAAFDLFASAPGDLPGATAVSSTFAPDTSLATTTSPQFPHGASPALPFSLGAFDPLTPNALELAHGSPAAPLLAIAPFSPVVLPSAGHTPASFAATPYTPHPSSFTPGVLADAALHPSPGALATRRLSAFEPIAFDPAHAALDDKYDPRRGKFGLPSPDSDNEGRALVHRPGPAPRSWYETVCDPRVALAERLRRQRLGPAKAAPQSTFRGATAGALPPPPQRAWLRRRAGPPLGLGGASVEGGTPSSALLTADEAESEQSSSDSDKDDAMDIEGPPRPPRDAEHGEDDDRFLDGAFGAALLGGAALVKRCFEPASALPAPALEAVKADPARELTYHVVAEHLTFHPDLREATLAFSPRRLRSNDAPVPAHALASVSTALAGVCSALSPSPLFADHTALAPLVAEDAPAFLLRAQQCVVETSRAAVDFWRPMGFEPLPGAKNVTAFVVYEESGAEVHETVKEWLRAVGSTYEGLRLGAHTPGTASSSSNFAGIQDGLVPLPAGLLSKSQARDELKFLYAALSDASKTSQNTVVYLVAPLDDSPLSHGSPLASIIHQVSKSRHGASPVNMLPCAVPMSSIARVGPSTLSTSAVARLARLAFSVYDQLQIPVERLRFPMPETFPSARPPPLAPLGPAVRLFPAPAVNIAPVASRSVQFSLSWPPTALEVEHRHRLLQVCYGSRRLSEDSGQECLVVTTIDEKGESWKVAPRLIKIPVGAVADVQRVRLVWSFVKSLVDAVDVEWRVVLCKLGEPTGLEAKTWDSLLKEYLAVVRRPIHVTFACAELDPAIAVLPQHSLSRFPSAGSEDGEIASTGARDEKTALFEAAPSTFTFTPAEPVSLPSLPLTPAASTYFFHIPRLSSHAHAPPDLLAPADPTATSSYGLHFFLSHASRTSSYRATLGALVGDVRRSFVELAALGHARWGTSGRLAWHVEATGFALLLANQLS